tara:strand:- start:4733 stop:7738 length:3006 start_codon:yes stop_codon:yes gene_type:complete
MKNLLTLLFFFFSAMAYAQMTVSGLVTDENGDPMIGASILEKGTTNGTISEIDGTYSLAVASENSILEFSFTGYQTLEFSAAGGSVDVQMAFDAVGLEDIIIVGYAPQKRKDVTGSVSSVNVAKLEDVPLPSMQTALQGRAAGVMVTKNSGTPGGGIDVRVRGSTSINASNQPLYVVDGIPIIANTDFTQQGVGNAQLSVLADLNPDEIESMEVLKDAATAAIYGSRASNGVVLITTKRGKSGKTQFNFNASRGNQQAIKQIPTVDGPTYIEYITEVFGANIVGTEADSKWQDLIFRTSTLEDYSVNASGGTDKTKFFTSLGYNNDEGIMLGSRFQRFSGRLNLDQFASDKFSFGVNMGYTYSITNQIQNDNNIFGALSTAILLPPVVPVRNDDGSYGSAFGLENPVAAATEYSNTVSRSKVLAKVYAQFNITDDLSFRSSLGVDILGVRENIYEPRVLQSSATGVGVLGIIQNNRFINENVLAYTKSTGNHSIQAVGGVAFQEDKFDRSLAEAVDFPTDDFTGLTSGAQPLTTSGDFVGSNLRSFFANVNYNFDQKYFLTATYRADGSSRFVNNQWGYFPGVSVAWRLSNENFLADGPFDELKLRLGWGRTGNNAIGAYAARQLYGGGANYLDLPGTFPSQIGNPDLKWETTTSINAGLDIGIIDNRVTASIDYYQKNTEDLLLNRPIPTTSGFLSVLQNIGEVKNTGYELSLNTVNISGKDLEWSTSINVGYNKNEVVKLVDGIPIDAGFASRIAEGQPLGTFYGHVTDGIFQNQGEVEAHATQTGGTAPGDFRFKDISGGAGPDGILGTADDLAPDGVINDNDRDYLGKAIPDWTGGITNTLSYKGVDFSAFFQFATGFQIYNNNLAFAEGLNSVFAPTQRAWDNRWQNEGDQTIIPRLVRGDPNANRRDSDRFAEDGDYIRLKTLTLGYTLPSDLMDKAGIRRLRVYASAYNIWTATGYSWFDPEVSTFDVSNASAGTDFLTFPQPKSFVFGINLGF